MKSAVSALLVSIILSAAAFGMEVQPTNIVIPSAGGTFSFDFVANTSPGQDAYAAQATIGSISGPSTLTFNSGASEAVAASNTDYWVYGNSAGAAAIDNGGGSYTFSDGPDDPAIASINAGNILARFAFIWDGTVGNYTFNMDLDTASSFALLEDFSNAPFTLPTDDWFSGPIVDATDSSFTIHIPEPASIILAGFGGLALLRRHRA